METRYKIHPAIGVARVGESATSFDGPDVRDPGFAPATYRDGADKIKRQAARFRIYEYEFPNAFEADKQDGMATVREITIADVEQIEWMIKLGNRKMFTAHPYTDPANQTPHLSIPAELTITLTPANATALAAGAAQKIEGQISGTAPPLRVTLGEFATDADGRLRALAGKGLAGSLPGAGAPTDLRNPKWWDDTADGPVRAKLTLNGGAVVMASSAWLVTASPDYAHAIECTVSLYDLAYSIACDNFGYTPPARPSMRRHIYPILLAAERAGWTSNQLLPHFGASVHAFTTGARFDLLRSNNKAIGSPARAAREALKGLLRNGAGGTMPKLRAEAAAELALPAAIYKIFEKWAQGEFVADFFPAIGPIVPSLAMRPARDRGNALDQAHMGAMVGGGFFPGIEVGKDINDLAHWAGAFRIKDTIVPGTLTKDLAVPWQSDFSLCTTVWWPSHRPDVAIRNGATATRADFRVWHAAGPAAMVDDWKKLGFLRTREIGGKTVIMETERKLAEGAAIVP